MKRVTCLLAMVAVVASAAAVANATDTTVSDTGVQARWQPREITFHYMGFNTFYECNGLEDRLENILKRLGAKPDVRAIATGCFAPSRVSGMITVRIRASMPVTADAAVDASKLQGEPFAAQRSVVSLKTHEDGHSGAGDCELLEQLRGQLMPVLKLQIVKDDLHCVPGQATAGNAVLQVAALVPVPTEK